MKKLLTEQIYFIWFTTVESDHKMVVLQFHNHKFQSLYKFHKEICYPLPMKN